MICRGALLIVAVAACVVGSTHAGELDDLLATQGRINSLMAAGQYAEATPLAEHVVGRIEVLYPGQTEMIITCRDNLATLYAYQARWADAEAVRRRIVAASERAYGRDSDKVAAARAALALALMAQQDFDDSAAEMQRVMEIHRRRSGPRSTPVAIDLLNLGSVCMAQSKWTEAEDYFGQALAIVEGPHGPDTYELAASLHTLAAAYMNRNEMAMAERMFRLAANCCDSVLGPNHQQSLVAKNNLAMAYFHQSRLAEAEQLYRELLATREKVLGSDHPDVAGNLNNLAGICMSTGRYEEAIEYFKRSAAIFAKLGEPHRAELAGTENNLGYLYEQQGNLLEAVAQYEKAVAIGETLPGPAHPMLLSHLNNLASAYGDLKRYAEAERHYLRVISLAEKAYGVDSVSTAQFLHNLASLYDIQGKFDQAEPLVTRAVNIWERDLPTSPHLPLSYAMRAEIRLGLGRRADALADLRSAMDAAEGLREVASAAEHERAQAFSGFSSIYERMFDLQMLEGDVAEAFAAAERSRARSLIDQMAAGNIDPLAGLPEAQSAPLRARDAAAQANVRQLESQLQAIDADTTIAQNERTLRREALQSELSQARAEAVAAYNAVRNASPTSRRFGDATFDPVALAAAQERVCGEGGLLLEYFLGEHNGYVIVVPPKGQAPRLVRLGLNARQAETLGVEAGPLNAAVLRRALSNEAGAGVLDLLRDVNRASGAANRLAVLYEALIPAAERDSLKNGKYSRLTVVPDGPLAMLPFDALIVRPGVEPQYLLDVGPPIVAAPSATIFLRLNDSTTAAAKIAGRQPVLTLGDPAYDDAASEPRQIALRSRYVAARGSFERLPFSGSESDWVVDVFHKAGFSSGQLRGPAATELNATFNMPGRKVVHLACHGVVDQKFGNLFGALVLAPGPAGDGPPNDGYLTLAEIYALDLKGCELAILSACDTNFGPQQEGEGAWSLARGFLVAGARRVVATNWVVDDEAGATLVSYFCEDTAAKMKAGKPDCAAALHEAKRAVRNQEKWSSPYYWATFSLIGPP